MLETGEAGPLPDVCLRRVANSDSRDGLEMPGLPRAGSAMVDSEQAGKREVDRLTSLQP